MTINDLDTSLRESFLYDLDACLRHDQKVYENHYDKQWKEGFLKSIVEKNGRFSAAIEVADKWNRTLYLHNWIESV